ncbi:MAG TPA: ubiquitin-conjugating enzyme E2 [Gelria sp.]|jgi:ubiquitin-protein ligase|nr:ubiquitin-conjugating enzyme E2 [Gelria sp.]
MSARLRRLAADYEKILNEAAGHKYIKIEPLGPHPPERYLVTYNVKGLKWDKKANRPVEINQHQVEIYLSESYPREKPLCEIKTEIFHPNFQNRGSVCISDYWAAGETLWDVIVQIGEMIQYQNYNPKSPLDARAAKWARANEHLFPVGKVDLYQPDPEVEIGVEVAASMDDDDLDITLFPSKNNKDLDNLDDIDIEFN